MKKPWQIWTIYLLCLLPLIAGLAWLSERVVHLDAAEADARRRQQETALQGEFEADVRLALRRLDLALAELLAREAAWPHYAFRSYFRPPESPDSAPVPSPLLHREAKYVKLYFQFDEHGELTSPQVPRTPPLAHNGPPGDHVTPRTSAASDRLRRLSQLVNRETLLGRIPAATVSDEVLLAINATWSSAIQPNRSPALPAPVQEPTPDAEIPDPAVQQAANPSEQLSQQLNSNDSVLPAPQLAQAEPPNQAQSSYQGQFLDQQFRNESDYQSRKRRIESYGNTVQQQVWNRERLGQGKVVGGLDVETNDLQEVAGVSAAIEGIAQPVWIGEELMLLRRVVVDGRTIIQGVWLDWSAIRAVLQQEVSELFPQLSMLPVHDEALGDPARMLASAPITLNVLQPRLAAMQPETMSPTMIALVVAWSCLAAAAVAAAVLLAGVVALSERRAAFVSAVTHELRTPLTTFRMYAEMLALGMVREESQRRVYLETLRTEADRLFHLVENVLSYARLERGAAAAPRTAITVDELLAACKARLTGRAAEAGMDLRIDLPAEFGPVQLATDRAAVEQILFNLVDNACKYARAAEDRTIQLQASTTRTQVLLRVVDHGPGIAPQAAAALFRPFTKSATDAANTAPGVGLGLALCRRLARDLGGDLQLEPRNGDLSGASFVVTLPR